MPPFPVPRRTLFALAFTLLIGASCATNGPAAADPSDSGVALASLMARTKQENRDYQAVYRELKPEFEAFAREHAGTEDGLSAKLWLLRETWWLREGSSGAAMDAASGHLIDEILAEYPQSKQLAQIAEFQFVIAAAQKVPLFEKILAASPHAEVRAAMLLQLGVQGRRSKDAAAKALAEQRLNTLIEDYNDVPSHFTTYGRLADAHLHPLAKADLAVGKTAPEIVGADLDGKPMKLSDQRGKVIVLDFWGFW